MNQFFVDHIAVITLLLLVLLILSLVFVFYLYQNQKKLQKRIRSLTKGRKASSLEGIIQECIGTVSEMEEKYDRLASEVRNRMEKQVGSAIYKTRMLRYNAYEGQGGELSFIWILLDHNNSGYLLHNVYNREGSSCLYTRVIESGASLTRLAPEEEKLLNEVMEEQ